MKRMMVLIMLVLSLGFFFSACSAPAPGEDQLQKDLIESELYLEVIDTYKRYNMILGDLEIAKRITSPENKTDEVWVNASIDGDLFSLKGQFLMQYSLYNDGWGIASVERIGNDWDFIPNDPISEEEALALLPSFSTITAIPDPETNNSECYVYYSVDEDYPYYTCHVNHRALFCFEAGRFGIPEWSIDEDDEIESSEDWNIEGVWTYTPEEYSWGLTDSLQKCELEISRIDGRNFHIKWTVKYDRYVESSGESDYTVNPVYGALVPFSATIRLARIEGDDYNTSYRLDLHKNDGIYINITKKLERLYDYIPSGQSQDSETLSDSAALSIDGIQWLPIEVDGISYYWKYKGHFYYLAYAREGDTEQCFILDENGNQIGGKYTHFIGDDFADGLLRLKQNGKYGCIDPTGQVAIPFIYDRYITRFSDGLARVNKDGKEGFIDTKGKVVIPLDYETSGNDNSFYNGLAVVKKDGKFGYIDTKGNTVIPLEYDGARSFYDRIAEVEKNGKFGCIDTKAKVIVPLEYDSMTVYEGIVKVSKGGMFGCLDYSGKTIVPLEYDDIWTTEDSPIVVEKGGRYGCFDRNGQMIVPLEYDDIGQYSPKEGLVPVKKGNKYGYMNAYGELTIPLSYDYANDFHYGYGAVQLGNKLDLLNAAGENLASFEYDNIEWFSEGLACVLKDRKLGYIDSMGKLVIPLEYNYATEFHNGFAAVGKNERYGFIDKTGATVLPLEYDGASVLNGLQKGLDDLSEDIAYCTIKTGTRLGILVLSNGEVTANSSLPSFTTPVPTPSNVGAQEYILPDSSEKVLTISEVESLSKSQLELARNEIFARHGRIFQDEELKQYFESKSWYKGTIKPEDFSNDLLSSVEKANVELIKSYENGFSVDSNQLGQGYHQANNNYYIFPDSSTKLLTVADIQGKSKDDLEIGRNEIYARHGRKFNDPILSEYFDGQAWYKGTVNPEDFTLDLLNSIEKQNIAFLSKYE